MYSDYGTQYDVINEYLQSPVRQIDAVVYGGGKKHTKNDTLVSFTIDRIGESSRFFGFGVTHKINVKVIDVDRTSTAAAGDSISVEFNLPSEVSSLKDRFLPDFIITEVHRDENTNQLSITAYDKLAIALDKYTIADLQLPTVTRAVVLEDGTTAVDEEGNTIYETVYEYSAYDFLNRAACLIEHGKIKDEVTESNTNTFRYFKYEVNGNVQYGGLQHDVIVGANFEGTEPLKAGLDAMAEYLGAIYYSGYTGVWGSLVLAKIAGVYDSTISTTGYKYQTFDITKDQYFTLDSGDNRRLTRILYTTELGDNLDIDTGVSGTTQYVKDNPIMFGLTDNEKINEMENTLDHFKDIRFNQFEMNWRGNFNIAIGDCLKIETKDGDYVTGYLLDDTITYDGALSQKTRWRYEEVGVDVTGNPTTIGDKLEQTFAKVDKVNKEIEIVASDISATNEEIAAIKMNTDNISLSVESIEKSLSDSTESLNGQIEEIQKKVDLGITAEDVTISVKETLKSGVEEITTETGFTFNNEGLTIDKSDSEMKTQITEDGMVVYKNDEAMLTADNTGVYAQNLHATTYLIIGAHSRFEDYEIDGEARTGCFWLGGN